MKHLCWLMLVLTLPTTVWSQVRLGRHTVAEWRDIIDTTWGAGETTDEKLRIFDLFWDAVDQQYAGFRGIEDKWQQMRSYRDTVALGVSRGRFAGICGHLVQSLQDVHMNMCDVGVSSTPLSAGVPLLYPLGVDMPSQNWGAIRHFGACLTPLPDSSLLVYAAVDNHPLGLVRGDVVLGYDGMLWKDLIRELLKIQFPPAVRPIMSGSARAGTHQLLGSAGMNWHLFDTIDIVRNATGDTVHLPTNLLSAPMPEIHATEQMPVDGVPFPDVASGRLVGWGYVRGTKIGYIYSWGWSEGFIGSLLPAVNALMPDSASDGLIIDLRLNQGGAAGFIGGFQRLFNQDIEPMRSCVRSSPADHLAMRDNGPDHPLTETDRQIYDRPIAVLCGPSSLSGGDKSTHLLRHHPMVRTFGLPTNGSFSKVVINSIAGIPSPWLTWMSYAADYTPPDMNDLLLHRSVPVDEEVWLTRAGVAVGEDDVVKRALAWISSLAHAHDVDVSRNVVAKTGDSVAVRAKVENPENHLLSVSAIIADANNLPADSVLFMNDGLHGDGAAGDSIWGATLKTPSEEGFFGISVQTVDQTRGTSRRVPNVRFVTSTGPVIIDSTSTRRLLGENVRVDLWLRSAGKDSSIPSVVGILTTKDPNVKAILSNTRKYGTLNPGEPRMASYAFTVDTSVHSADLLFTVEVSSSGIAYWAPEALVRIRPTTGVISSDTPISEEYRLGQNYPNPFNPTTIIRYGLPAAGHVRLTVHDLLGREVSVLVNERKDAGVHEVKFNGSGLSSGVYLYRLQAGDFVQTRKLLLLQ